MKLLELGITQRELADKVGASWAFMNHILCGRKSGEKYLRQVCEILKLDYDEVSNIKD
jgi:cyanate lyase